MEHPWTSALVTGASSGIGDAFARSLGQAGVDLVLVARRADRLARLADDLRVMTSPARPDGPSVEVLAADLTDPTDRATTAARLGDAERPVDLLVNCAGVGASGPFVEGDLDRYRQIVDLNIEAVVELTHAALGPMVDRRRGWILNVSSLGGHAPGPGFAVYSASKAFVTSFSESLHEEVRRSGVVVTALCPGATRTPFGQDTGADDASVPDLLWQDADDVADEGLAAAAAGRAVRVTGRVNRLSAALTTVLPRSANRRLSALVTERL
ncbi:MAG: SDR family NAD(P)-dependent oxidoreductase [Acidimicrobiales bacterium]